MICGKEFGFKVIAPTKKCFDNALDFLEAVAKEHGREELLKYELIHGICAAPDDGRLYAHAWVERAGAVFEGMLGDGELFYMKFPVDVFYRIRGVRETKRYSPYEAWQENSKSGHYGPWEQRFMKLCNDKRNDQDEEKNHEKNHEKSHEKTI